LFHNRKSRPSGREGGQIHQFPHPSIFGHFLQAIELRCALK